MSRKKSHVRRNSKGSKSKGGTKHATQLAARDRRASLEPVAHLDPTVAPPEPDQAPADMAFTDEWAPTSAPRAEARDKVGLGKMDERQAQVCAEGAAARGGGPHTETPLKATKATKTMLLPAAATAGLRWPRRGVGGGAHTLISFGVSAGA
ncbi:hypothetical protein T492DRAFT_910780 [Pavlovales sp. CCMP2436]|nr:hypothetical protein T492DRAFT_910780 [Pavlovales sp. CCMP2436]